MKLLLIGDIHMNVERAEEINDLAIDQEIDKVIGLGDFGYTFAPDFVAEVSGQDIPWYFIDGNHDDHTLLKHDANEIVRFHDNLFYIPRGYVWEWEGKTFAGMGGAYSIDKVYRTAYVSWWPEEQISMGDYYRFQENAHGKTIDIMLSHEAPSSLIEYLSEGQIMKGGEEDRIILERILHEFPPKIWLHGHWHYAYEYHDDKTHFIGLGCDQDSIQEQIKILEI